MILNIGSDNDQVDIEKPVEINEDIKGIYTQQREWSPIYQKVFDACLKNLD